MKQRNGEGEFFHCVHLYVTEMICDMYVWKAGEKYASAGCIILQLFSDGKTLL